MSSDITQVADEQGVLLDAHVSVRQETGDMASITLESQGGGRNKDYIKAHSLIICRLAGMSATLVDAMVASSDTKRLGLEARRFLAGSKTYPMRLTPDADAVSVARMLRRGAAEVGRRDGATGPGNRAKRVEIRFVIDGLGAQPPSWLFERLINPAGTLGEEASPSPPQVHMDRSSQYMLDAAARKAVEVRAMQMAIERLREKWDRVLDVSATESFDLLCQSASETLHVEVKGTTSDGETIVLTRNEVLHARNKQIPMALYVVSKIDLMFEGSIPIATGGVLTCYEPWTIDEFELQPLSFQCRLKSSPRNEQDH